MYSIPTRSTTRKIKRQVRKLGKFKSTQKENLMNKSFPLFSILAAIVLFATAYGALVVQAQSAVQVQPAGKPYRKLPTMKLSSANL